MFHVTLPRWLTSEKKPDAARAELDDYLAYLKERYGIQEKLNKNIIRLLQIIIPTNEKSTN